MDAEAWDRRYTGTELLWKAEPNRFVVKTTANLAPGRALDLACGEGRNAVWLAGRGWRVVGVDFSAVALHKARVLAGHAGVDGVEWVHADILSWQPEPGAFDLVLLSYLHLPREQRREVLGTATSALAVGGRLVVVGHDRANLTDGYGGPQDPSILLDTGELLDDLLDLTGSAGPVLGVERAGPVTRTVPSGDDGHDSHGEDDAEHTAIDTLVVIVRPP